MWIPLPCELGWVDQTRPTVDSLPRFLGFGFVIRSPGTIYSSIACLDGLQRGGGGNSLKYQHYKLHQFFADFKGLCDSQRKQNCNWAQLKFQNDFFLQATLG